MSLHFAPHVDDPPALADPRDQAPAEFFTRCAASGIPVGHARRWLAAVVGEGICEAAALRRRGVIPARVGPAIGDLPQLRLAAQRTSPRDGFEKLLFRGADGAPIETVIIPLHKPGCASVCLSSQVGCAMACDFCATARMSRRRNLATWEIVDQFVQARRIAAERGRRVTGAVFMGMGEPFLNYRAVIAAAEHLCMPAPAAIAARAITVSTVGLVDQIRRFTDEGRRFRLSVSLGAAIDETRRLLVPIAARTPVAEVMAAARRHALTRRERVNLAYVCVGGVNVSVEDARALGALVGDTPVRLDLIDVEDSRGVYRKPTPRELEIFRDALREHVPHPVARRYSGGADIAAACGTLAGIG